MQLVGVACFVFVSQVPDNVRAADDQFEADVLRLLAAKNGHAARQIVAAT